MEANVADTQIALFNEKRLRKETKIEFARLAP